MFARVTAAGLLLNFAAIPLMAVVQAGGMTLLAAHVLVPAAVPAVGLVTHLAAWGLVESARLVDLMPWAVARVPAPAPGVAAAYYAAWIGWFAAWHMGRTSVSIPTMTRWLRRAAWLLIVACGGWIVLTPPLRLGRTPLLEATFIDVGQGAATLVGFRPATRCSWMREGREAGGSTSGAASSNPRSGRRACIG